MATLTNTQLYDNFVKFKKVIEFFAGKIPRCLNFDFFKFFCKESQSKKVLWHLEEFGFITNLQCHAIYGIRHAPSVIRDIRKKLAVEGKYRIDNETQHSCNKFGRACTFDKYVLVEIKKYEPEESA